jgi:xenotropic and polytropic retrovirus receptor 1
MFAKHLSGLQPHTRVDIPSWASLLFVYANLLVPTLLAFLVGANMLIWTASRINYVFIFGTTSRKFSAMSNLSLNHCKDLDIRSRLDHREYFEVHSRRLRNA